jgi:squalene-hopene/tetraprenyl-beta-curcumene cyclase
MPFTSWGRTFLLIVLPLPVASTLARAGDAPAGWRTAEAGAYLDERAKTWLAFPSAGRGAAETKTVCVSCHTTLPYALARPALRRLTGDGRPTAYEAQLLGYARLRVEHWEDLDSPQLRLLYDFNDQKKTESRGTEAVLNALLLALDDRVQGRREPGDATRRAFAHLWQAQAADGDHRGAWEWLDFHLEPWESPGGRYFGATLAAVAVGAAPGYYTPGADAATDRAVKLLRGYLRDHRAGQTLHNRAWLLWAASGLDGLLTPEERKAVIGELLEPQGSDGGWRLAALGPYVRGDGTPQDAAADGYATGLVLHVLQTAGVPRDDPKIAAGLSWLRASQSPSGEWRGTSANKKRDPTTHVGRLMTDAATAYAVLALSH